MKAKSVVRVLLILLFFVPGVPLASTSAAEAGPMPLAAGEPAVEIPEETEDEAEDPWTARFLAPAVVVIGVVSVGAAVSYYVVRIRGRYRVA